MILGRYGTMSEQMAGLQSKFNEAHQRLADNSAEQLMSSIETQRNLALANAALQQLQQKQTPWQLVHSGFLQQQYALQSHCLHAWHLIADHNYRSTKSEEVLGLRQRFDDVHRQLLQLKDDHKVSVLNAQKSVEQAKIVMDKVKQKQPPAHLVLLLCSCYTRHCISNCYHHWRQITGSTYRERTCKELSEGRAQLQELSRSLKEAEQERLQAVQGVHSTMQI